MEASTNPHNFSRSSLWIYNWWHEFSRNFEDLGGLNSFGKVLEALVGGIIGSMVKTFGGEMM